MKYIWLLLLPVLLLLPGLAAFPYPPGANAYSDFAITHYPNAVYLRQSLLEWRTLPLWSSTILSGYPLGANPLSGLWYLPGWLALAFPLPLGINIALLLHWLLAGIGMYALLRAERLSRAAALFGALAFEALPKLFAHYGAGHVTLIYAVCWTPWLLLSARGWLLRAGERTPTRFYDRLGWAFPPVVMALILLADVRWAVYAGLVLLGYALSLRWSSGREGRTVPASGPSFWRIGLTLAGWMGLAMLFAAPLLVSMLEYTHLSTRMNLQPSEAMVYSLPPGRLLGLLFPDLGGFQEFTLYAGVAVLMLSVLALLCRRSRRGAMIWGIFALIGVLLSLGDFFPLAPALVQLPVFGWLRVPSRALFITGISLAALSAWGIEAVLAPPETRERRNGALFLTGIAGFAVLLTALARISTGKLPAGFLWGGAFSLMSAVWISLKLKERVEERVWLVGIFALCLVDLLFVDSSLFESRPAERVLSQGAQAAETLRRQPGIFRTYSPSYSLPQQTGAVYGLELADGVDPLQLQAYADYMEKASGVPTAGYSVTLPPFANGDPRVANASFTPDAELLGRLNVGYVLAAYDLRANGLELAERFGETRLYRNLLARPRAWVTLENGSGEDISGAEQIIWSPNHIQIRAQGPGVLTLSEINYPGWQVRLDGKRADAYSDESLLRAVRMPEGEHIVEWSFRPASVYIGLALAGAGWILMAGLALWGFTGGNRRAARNIKDGGAA